MNSKLIILIFALIGVQTISSSILKNQLANNENWIEVDEINFVNGGEFVNYFDALEEKEFTLNKSEIVVIGNERIPEVRCLDKAFESDVPNKFCHIVNGRYQVEFVKCRRDEKKTFIKYECQPIAKVTNKNVKFSITNISCNGAIFYGEPHKGNCAYKYAFENNESFDEKDDVLNDEI